MLSEESCDTEDWRIYIYIFLWIEWWGKLCLYFNRKFVLSLWVSTHVSAILSITLQFSHLKMPFIHILPFLNCDHFAKIMAVIHWYHQQTHTKRALKFERFKLQSFCNSLTESLIGFPSISWLSLWSCFDTICIIESARNKHDLTYSWQKIKYLANDSVE